MSKYIKRTIFFMMIIICIYIIKSSYNVENYYNEYGIKQAESSISLREETGFVINGNYFWGIEPYTEVQKLDLGLSSGYTFKLLNSSDTEKQSTETIVIGDKIQIYFNNDLINEYMIVIAGDANKDGKISPLDYVKVKNHIMETNTITDEDSLQAADYNHDSKVSPLDYVKIRNYIMNSDSETITITYNSNGGTGTMSVQEGHKKLNINLLRNTFTREGYAFVSWNTAQDGSGITYYDVHKIELTNNLVLYAQWKEIGDYTLSIKYNGNGGTWNTPAHDTYDGSHPDGYVRYKDGDIYIKKLKYNDDLGTGGLVDYNAGYMNWTRDGYSITVGEEYIIDGTEVALDQARQYTAVELANAINCDLTKTDCSMTVKVNWKIYKLSIKYNGNGGTWNTPAHDTYDGSNEDGYVRYKDGDVYINSIKINENLGTGGLVDYNGGYMNWTKDVYYVPTGEEYIIDGTEVALDQARQYTAVELANAINCDLTKTNCSITVKVNWKISTLSIQYNGNGGTWNEDKIPIGKKIFVDDQPDGMVRLRSNGEIYKSNYAFDEENIDLVDYNGGFLNWSRTNYGVSPQTEYYIENGNQKTELDQAKSYKAIDLANYGGCNSIESDCVITVYVNWEEYLITDADYLKTSGTKFVKVSNDNGVVLRGLNLGGWLSRSISNTPTAKTNRTDFNPSEIFVDSNPAYASLPCDGSSSNWKCYYVNGVLTKRPFNTLETARWREYADNDVQMIYLLNKRFGKDNEFELNQLYYENFISEEDLDYMEELGINVVRVPISWVYFVDFTFNVPSNPPVVSMSNPIPPSAMNAYKYTYTMLTGTKLNRRLQRLDWIVHECRKRGIYVIFDLHVVDGGQSDYGLRPQRGTTFYDDQNAQNNAKRFWEIIAERFNGNPGVAGYELLNEPSAGIKSNTYINRTVDFNMYRDDIIKFSDIAYKAIRDIDPNHIIFIESPYPGYPAKHQIYMENNGTPLLTLPTEAQRTNGISDSSICPATQCKWDNVSYVVHDYYDDCSNVTCVQNEIDEKIANNLKDLKKYNVPLFISEVNFTYTSPYTPLDEEITNEIWPDALKQYDNNLFSYTIWNYKLTRSNNFGVGYNMKGAAGDDPTNGNISNYFALLLCDDDACDSYDTIAKKWSYKTSEAVGYEKSTIYETILKNDFVNRSNKPLFANYSYTCKAGASLTSTIKIFSKDGSVIINDISSSNPSLASVSFIDPVGVVCTSTSCKTIKIDCNGAGTVTLTATASNGVQTTSTVTVSNN